MQILSKAVGMEKDIKPLIKQVYYTSSYEEEP